MATDRKKLKASELLFERERNGLRTLTITRGLIFSFLMVSAWGLAASQFEAIVTTGICMLVLFAVLVSLKLLSQDKGIRVIGLTGCLTDVALLAALPVIWYFSVGGTQVPPAYMLKTHTTVFILTSIALNTIAIRPLYPMIVAVGGLCIQGVLLTYILLDPRTVLSSDFVDSVMGEALTLELVIAGMLLITFTGMAMGYLAWAARRTIVDGVNLEVTNNQLGRYFSPGVVSSISSNTENISGVGGRSQNAAVMFCDIRDFTSLSESLQPSDVVQFLSDYHSKMVAAIFANDGTIDKFIGDAIMVTFGTPEPANDDIERAVRAGIAMNKALEQLNKDRGKLDLPQIKHGIGIHYGPVIAGNIGTEDRLEYTVIGDTVNVASRIQDLCKTVGKSFLVSEAVRRRLPEGISVTPLDRQNVKGRQAAVDVYAVT